MSDLLLGAISAVAFGLFVRFIAGKLVPVSMRILGPADHASKKNLGISAILQYIAVTLKKPSTIVVLAAVGILIAAILKEINDIYTMLYYFIDSSSYVILYCLI